MTTAALPWIYYGTLMLHKKHSAFNLLLAVIPRVALFYCGHPQFFIYSAIFDFLFASSYVLIVKTEQKSRLRAFVELICEYVVSYVIVTLACLPLMLPMLDLAATSERSQKLSFETFTSFMIISGVGFYGIASAIFTAAGILLIILMLTSLKTKLDQYDKEIKVMMTTLPSLFISLLWMLSIDFNRIIYLIPILNRFRYQHKLTLFLVPAAVILSSMVMTMAEKHLKAKGIKQLKTIMFSLLAFQIASLISIYALGPHKTAGIICENEIPYHEAFAEELYSGRYVSFGFNDWSIDPASGLQVFDIVTPLQHNLASYFGFNNVCGYYSVMMNTDVYEYSEFFSHISDYSGNLSEVYPGFVDDMRDQSVRWYITDIDYKEDVADYFAGYGITEAYEDDKKVIFEDKETAPLAYDESGNEVCLKQNVNSLELVTPADFSGGTITMNYSYDEYFTGYIDGEPVEITPGANNWGIALTCPPGEHQISISYVERGFCTGLAVSVAGLGIVTAGLVLISRKTRSSDISSKTEEN